MDEKQKLVALATAEAQTAGTQQAMLFALEVMARAMASPELQQAFHQRFEAHRATMLQSAWPESMLSAFDHTARMLEAAAGLPAADTRSQPG